MYGTRNARQYTRPDICVGTAHPQLLGAWRVRGMVRGVSQHRTSRGGLVKGATRAREFVIFHPCMRRPVIITF